MDSLVEYLEEWIMQGLIEAVTNKFNNILESVNEQVGGVATQVGQTPQGWNSGIFSMIKTLSETVVLPVAGMILTFVLCYELISMIIEKNNMQDFDTFNIYKWIFKTFVAAYILSNTFTMVMGVFELSQTVVNGSVGIITSSLEINAAVSDLQAQLEAMTFFELIGLWLEMNILSICMEALAICIFVIVFGRMIEIYLVVSVAPIPLSTMTNREWGTMGNNYLKSLFAIGFQGFLIMICLAIYSVLIQNIGTADNVRSAIWSVAGYTVLLALLFSKQADLQRIYFQRTSF